MARLLLILLVSLWSATVWAGEEVGRQEDTAFSDGQVLMPIGCVRQDTIASSTSTDGDYNSVKCGSTGRVYTSATIDAALPTGANSLGTVGLNAGANSIGTVGLNAGANAIGSVTVTSQVPGTGATNLGKAAAGTFTASDTGVQTLCVRRDTSTTGLGANGTYNSCGLTSLGEVYTSANTELPAAVALTDNTANPTVPGIAAFMMCFDGTTWDRCLPGLSDTDDNSVAFSQITSLVIGATHVSDGTSWTRLRTYLEDVAASGHDGGQLLMMGAVRQDAPAGSTSLDGDYANLKTDSVGRLWVNCGSGCASGSTTPTDAFANPTTAALNMTFNMGWNGATWDRFQMDGSKFLKVNCASGCAGGSTTPADAFANPTTAGLQMVFPVGWNGATWDRLQVDASKFLKVNCASGCAGGSTTPSDAFANPTTAGLQATFNMGWNGATWDRLKSTTANGLVVDVSRLQTAIPAGNNNIGDVDIATAPYTAVEDAAETAGGTGVFVLSVRRDTLATSSNSSGDNSTINTNSLGALYVQPTAGPSGGASTCYLTSAATTNATNCKASAGTLYTVSVVNTTATLYYLRLYNLASAPTCSSATGFVETIPVPASTSGAGVVRDVAVGQNFGTGIGFCLTGGGSSTDNTSAATGVYLTMLYN